MTAATLMVVNYLFTSPLALATAAGAGLLAAWLWFVEPALDRRANGTSRHGRHPEETPPAE